LSGTGFKQVFNLPLQSARGALIAVNAPAEASVDIETDGGQRDVTHPGRTIKDPRPLPPSSPVWFELDDQQTRAVGPEPVVMQELGRLEHETARRGTMRDAVDGLVKSTRQHEADVGMFVPVLRDAATRPVLDL